MHCLCYYVLPNLFSPLPVYIARTVRLKLWKQIYIENSTHARVQYTIIFTHVLSVHSPLIILTSYQGPRLQDIALRSTGGTASNDTFTFATGRVLRIRIRSVMALQLMFTYMYWHNCSHSSPQENNSLAFIGSN